MFPSRMDLVGLWMATHFRGTPSVVFFDPVGDGDRVEKFVERLNFACGTSLGSLVNCDVYVMPHPEPVPIVHGLDEDEWGFVMAWNGESFTSHN